MRILFKLTTRSRPLRAIKTLESIFNNVQSDNFIVLISLDEDDITTPDVYDWCRGRFEKIVICFGKSENKIDAINRDVERIRFKWDILVNVSDDQVFIKKGFDKYIRESFTDLDKFIHFPDGNQEQLATMSIIGYDYYLRDKYIYHPSYKSVYCDNEAQDVAQMRGCYIYNPLHIFNHEHPAWGKAEFDGQYSKNEHPSLYFKDEANYKSRKNENFIN